MSEAGAATPAPETAGDRISRQVADLRAALEIGGDRISPEVAAKAGADLDQVEARLEIGVDRTVVALVGGTGSGKSSLFNAISGLEFAEVGVRRPTTAQATACTWGGAADPLLDLLEVNRRQRIRRESALDGAEQNGLAGLVLLDMPDHDSIAADHARLVDRLVPLVDLLVWVVDPQKYADNALHERYLRALVERQGGMLVLVNQVDTVPAGAVPRIVADVTRLLEVDGLHDVAVLPTSAATGAGIGDVRALLAGVVAGESMAAWVAGIETAGVVERLDADLAAPVAQHVGPGPGGSDASDIAAAAVDRLARSCGVDAVEAAIRRAVSSPRRRQALVRPDEPTVATACSVRDAWIASAGQGLPSRWAADLDRRVTGAEGIRTAVRDRLSAVALPGTDAAGGWRWTGAGALLLAVGALLLAVAGGGSGLAFGMAAGGVVISLACFGMARRIRRREAERRATAFAGQARSAVSEAVEDALGRPTNAVVAEWEQARAAVGRARRPGPAAPPQRAG